MCSMLQRHLLLAGQSRPSLVPCSHASPRQAHRQAGGRPRAQSETEQHRPDSNQRLLSGSEQYPGSSTRSAVPIQPVQAAAAAAAAAAAPLPITSSTNNNNSSSSIQAGPGVASEFHPQALTIGLQRAASVQALAALWQAFQHQFNSYHFSALMQQLTKLHGQVNAGLAQGPAQPQMQQQQQHNQQAQQQQQQRMDSLAELEQELGHLLDSNNGSSPSPAAGGSNSSCKKSSSSVRRVRSSSSHGLADLFPASTGYEHLGSSSPAAASSQRRQQQQQERLAWRAQPPSQQQQQQGPVGADAAAGLPIAGGSMSRPVRPPGQAGRPQWRPPAQGVLGGSSSSKGRGPQRQQQFQQGVAHPRLQPQPVQQAEMLQQMHQLALEVAAVAVQPDVAKTLDLRALVMVARNLAKMQLYDSTIMQQLLRALGAQALPQLDPQQLTNLIWSVGSCVGGTDGDERSPYQTLAVPVVLRRSGAVVAVAAAAAEVGSGVGESRLGEEREDGMQWEQVAAVAELATAADADAVAELKEGISAAAAADLFADAASGSVPSVLSSSRGDLLPAEWLAAAADALLQQLPKCKSQGVAMALWGFAELGFSPPAEWWEQFWGLTQCALPQYSAQDLALLMCAVGKLGPEVPAPWLTAYCSAACDVMARMSSQQLTMCLWGLGVSGASPHKAFVLLWFLTSMGLMQQATTQELSMWLYALTLLRITPSPSWCAAFVEASFTRFTAPNTRPQDLVTAMWSISRLGWSPPLLYWRGLMEAARERFEQFGPQDLANCISAASVVDVSCVSDAWLSGFIKASQTRLSAFEPVQLAHTANALALLVKSHQSAFRFITAVWQAAFVTVAGQHLAAGRFSLRNLVLVVISLRLLQFKPSADVQQFLAEAELTLASMWPKQRQRQQQEEDRQGMDSPEAC